MQRALIQFLMTFGDYTAILQNSCVTKTCQKKSEKYLAKTLDYKKYLA